MTQNQQPPSDSREADPAGAQAKRQLLAQYARAMARFYLEIPLEEALEMIREHNPGWTLPPEEALALLSAPGAARGFRLAGTGPQEEGPPGREGLSEISLISPALEEAQSRAFVQGHKRIGYWLWPSREALLAYDDPRHVPVSDASDALFAFLVDTVMLVPAKAEALLAGLHRDRAVYVLDSDTYLRRPVRKLKSLGIALRGEALRELVARVDEAARHWPNPLYNGFTPEEVGYLAAGYVPVDSAISLGPDCKRRIRAGEEEMMNDLTRLILADRMPQRSVDRIITQTLNWLAPEALRENRQMFEQMRDPYYRQAVRARMGAGGSGKVPAALARRAAPARQSGAAAAPGIAPAPVRRIGRNDPCPCGSGKKYKKCCGKPGRDS